MNLISRDKAHVWHPYSSMNNSLELYGVEKAEGVRLHLSNKKILIDGMSSWWCAVHGYNHPKLNKAVEKQLGKMAHVMFGGLTHEPGVRLAEKLVELSPDKLQSVFFADSGSVSIEAAMKMSIQYWISKGQPKKKRFLSFYSGYHGDTFHAMSVCDPSNGMHKSFFKSLPKQFFVAAPNVQFGKKCIPSDFSEIENALKKYSSEIAGIIIEPIVQGAGGMNFYSIDYLKTLRHLCNQYDVNFITDEIATGFGRTGKFFACEHAEVCPDIMTVGKALTGGYMTLAAVLTTNDISEVIANGDPGIFMHGPTFMANPLACSVASASIDLLFETNWYANVSRIENGLKKGLLQADAYPWVRNTRVLGAIGVIELSNPINLAEVQPMFVERGVWVRPFGRLIYLMPPFVINDVDLAFLCSSTIDVVANLKLSGNQIIPNKI